MKSSTVLDLFCLPKGCCCIIFCTVLPLSEHMLLVNAWVISLKMTNWSDVCICMNTLKSWQGLQRQWLQPLSKAGNELCCFPSGVRTLHSSILDGWEQTHSRDEIPCAQPGKKWGLKIRQGFVQAGPKILHRGAWKWHLRSPSLQPVMNSRPPH